MNKLTIIVLLALIIAVSATVVTNKTGSLKVQLRIDGHINGRAYEVWDNVCLEGVGLGHTYTQSNYDCISYCINNYSSSEYASRVTFTQWSKKDSGCGCMLKWTKWIDNCNIGTSTYIM